jgi:hypothetical protein
MDIKFFGGVYFNKKIKMIHRTTQHIHYRLSPLPFGHNIVFTGNDIYHCLEKKNLFMV